MTFNAYETYCEHCVLWGRKPPTREWWDRACGQPQHNEHRDSDQREIDRERTEGWGYGTV